MNEIRRDGVAEIDLVARVFPALSLASHGVEEMVGAVFEDEAVILDVGLGLDEEALLEVEEDEGENGKRHQRRGGCKAEADKESEERGPRFQLGLRERCADRLRQAG